MKQNIIIYLIVFAAGAISVMLVFDKCSSKKLTDLSNQANVYMDSVLSLSHANEQLTLEREKLSVEKLLQDSVSKQKIDSLTKTISILKRKYYLDTSSLKNSIVVLQYALDNKDSLAAQRAIDSLVVELRSANWSVNNIFSQYEEVDSQRILQKQYDDSLYHELYIIDSLKDIRFNALVRINNQQGIALETAINEAKKAKSRNKFWMAIGVVLGLSTHLIK